MVPRASRKLRQAAGTDPVDFGLSHRPTHGLCQQTTELGRKRTFKFCQSHGLLFNRSALFHRRILRLLRLWWRHIDRYHLEPPGVALTNPIITPIAGEGCAAIIADHLPATDRPETVGVDHAHLVNRIIMTRLPGPQCEIFLGRFPATHNPRRGYKDYVIGKQRSEAVDITFVPGLIKGFGSLNCWRVGDTLLSVTGHAG